MEPPSSVARGHQTRNDISHRYNKSSTVTQTQTFATIVPPKESLSIRNEVLPRVEPTRGHFHQQELVSLSRNSKSSGGNISKEISGNGYVTADEEFNDRISSSISDFDRDEFSENMPADSSSATLHQRTASPDGSVNKRVSYTNVFDI